MCACATVEEEGDADPRVLAPFVEAWEEEQDDGMDLRLCLRGEYGRCVAMVLDSAVLCESSAFSAVGGKEIEVYGVENMAALRDAVEFMFDADAPRWLARAGVSRAIAVLECCQEKLAGYISKGMISTITRREENIYGLPIWSKQIIGICCSSTEIKLTTASSF